MTTPGAMGRLRSPGISTAPPSLTSPVTSAPGAWLTEPPRVITSPSTTAELVRSTAPPKMAMSPSILPETASDPPITTTSPSTVAPSSMTAWPPITARSPTMRSPDSRVYCAPSTSLPGWPPWAVAGAANGNASTLADRGLEPWKTRDAFACLNLRFFDLPTDCWLKRTPDFQTHPSAGQTTVPSAARSSASTARTAAMPTETAGPGNVASRPSRIVVRLCTSTAAACPPSPR